MGPLQGVRVVEVAGIGPGPFCGMMLADMGASVICVDRPGATVHMTDPLQRGRCRLTLDLKTPRGIDALLSLAESADVLFEGFRPGVAERLGFGPEPCFARRRELVYGRMTGWGQDGPLAQAAGHDINYIALSGALKAIGREGQRPVPPLNLVGDFGGGGMMLAFGIVCALFEARRSGLGQVIDAAMLDGSIALMAAAIGLQHQGFSCDTTGTHFLSGAAHYYDSYETSDGEFITVAALEPRYYELLIEALGLSREEFWPARFGGAEGLDPEAWRRLHAKLSAVFKTRSRSEWCDKLEGTDVCFAPVLRMSEAPAHPHNVARGNFVEVAGTIQNAPVPRFSRTPADVPQAMRSSRGAIEERLASWSTAPEKIALIVAARLDDP